MRKYEKDFKIILDYYHQTSVNKIHSSVTGLTKIELEYLQAKNLIHLTPFANGDPNFKIVISDIGITYFEDKYDKRKRVWISFISGAAATILIDALKWLLLLIQQLSLNNHS